METITNLTSGATTQKGHTTAPGSTSTDSFNSGSVQPHTLTSIDIQTNKGTICCISPIPGTRYYDAGFTHFDPLTGLHNVCYKITVTCCTAGYSPYPSCLCQGNPCMTVQIETVLKHVSLGPC